MSAETKRAQSETEPGDLREDTRHIAMDELTIPFVQDRMCEYTALLKHISLVTKEESRKQASAPKTYHERYSLRCMMYEGAQI